MTTHIQHEQSKGCLPSLALSDTVIVFPFPELMYRRGPALPLVTVHPLRPHQDNPILAFQNLACVHRSPANFLRTRHIPEPNNNDVKPLLEPVGVHFAAPSCAQKALLK